MVKEKREIITIAHLVPRDAVETNPTPEGSKDYMDDYLGKASDEHDKESKGKS